MMSYGLKTIFVGVAIIAAIVAISLQLSNRNMRKIDPLWVENQFVFIRGLNANDALLLVGADVTADLMLSVNGQMIAIETFDPGKHAFRIFWGGRELQFGFSANGSLHTLPFPYGVSNNSVHGYVKAGETRRLAVAYHKNDKVEVILKVRQKSVER